MDPHLEEIMSSLVTPSSSMIHSLYSSGTISDDLSNTPTNEGPPLLHTYLSLISHLSKVRGYKTIKKLFTHEAVDLEPTLMCLLSQDPQNHALWESRYALLLWLSMLALVPFDICTIDSTSESSTRTTSNLVETIIKISKSYLSDPGPVRESAAVCLSSVLTRPDMEEGYLQDFMEYAKEVLMIRVGIKKNDGDDGKSNTVSHLTDNTFLTMGLVHTLAHLFKYGHREKFLIYVDAFLEQIILLAENGGSQTMLRKLLVKLFQRVGTTFMPVRIVPWRYQRGRRSLLTNMESKGEGKEELTESEVTEEPDIYVPPELEDVVDQLLTGLRDRDTVVRWSAAKGLGRITERLPRECADDVVGAIMELFNDNETDSAWHGANLALAELARRGLLLPSRLPKVVPIIVRAIHYDVRRGQNSVGAHVRDAACYVCWAFARAYSPEVMKPYVEELAKGMLLAALFDREINCRRAASAAFQENVGRQGNENFKHGIEILTAADYFTLGNRVKAFTEISCFVAGFEKYRRSVIGHLKEVKLFHWDVEIRLLASQGLGNLVALDKNYMADVVLHELISKVCDPDLLVRHGAVLGIAEIVKALKSNVSSKHTEITNVVVEVEKARLYRGKGGEIMRSAICRLIECVSIAQLPLPVKTQVRLLDSVDDCIKHPLEEISLSAVAGLRALLKQYFPVASTGPSSRLHSRVFQKTTPPPPAASPSL
ncbi:hypothetical protein TL16_g01339 [Triparma laevis f. inornata]|uniref:Tubulin-folding cofactor D ARM repeats domain-containing protein n=1 Tax=Triparma laevis f. inornata TaxID=1714386 RepID=A0A9W6ZN21_9STRA|nr:hypothetical protein TL16_g01339 [Triparma laevis f. inornata]